MSDNYLPLTIETQPFINTLTGEYKWGNVSYFNSKLIDKQLYNSAEEAALDLDNYTKKILKSLQSDESDLKIYSSDC